MPKGVVETAARRAVANALTRLFGGFLRPKPTFGIQEGKTLGATSPKRTSLDGKRPPPRRNPNNKLMYVAMPTGFLHVVEEDNLTIFNTVADMRAATPFTKYSIAKTKADMALPVLGSNEAAYYTIVCPA